MAGTGQLKSEKFACARHLPRRHAKLEAANRAVVVVGALAVVRLGARGRGRERGRGFSSWVAAYPALPLERWARRCRLTSSTRFRVQPSHAGCRRRADAAGAAGPGPMSQCRPRFQLHGWRSRSSRSAGHRRARSAAGSVPRFAGRSHRLLICFLIPPFPGLPPTLRPAIARAAFLSGPPS